MTYQHAYIVQSLERDGVHAYNWETLAVRMEQCADIPVAYASQSIICARFSYPIHPEGTPSDYLRYSKYPV